MTTVPFHDSQGLLVSRSKLEHQLGHAWCTYVLVQLFAIMPLALVLLQGGFMSSESFSNTVMPSNWTSDHIVTIVG